MARHRTKISKRTKLAVYERDGWACHYCGLQFDPAQTWTPNTVAPFMKDDQLSHIFLELDHIHPVHHGGQNTEDNLCAACTRCNRRKSFKILEAAV